jgi:hypothetical protein
VNDTCIYYWDQIIPIKSMMFSLVMALRDLATRYHVECVKKNVQPLVLALITVWFGTRFCNARSFQSQVDVFTVFFLIGQFVFLICKWYCEELPCFSFTLHQASLCTLVAFISYAFYDAVFRYFPVHFKFGILWLVAIKDW